MSSHIRMHHKRSINPPFQCANVIGTKDQWQVPCTSNVFHLMDQLGVSEMQLLHFRVHSLVVFIYSFFQSCLERKLRHNRCYAVWLLLLHILHKEHMCIQMERSIIFQMGHSDVILRSYHAGYIVLYCLKLDSCRIENSWDFIWAFRFDVFLHCLGWCALLHWC